MKTFINLSNHPSSKWSDEQKAAAQKYGNTVDIPFPQIDPHASKWEIDDRATQLAGKLFKEYPEEETTIHIMGEMTYVFAFVKTALDFGYKCVASTTERIVIENPDGSKTSTFKFVQFREY